VGVVLLVACFAEAVEFNRWEVESCEEMAPIIQQCYESKDVECIMDFILSKGAPPELIDAQRAKLTHYVEHRTLETVICGPVSFKRNVLPTEVPTHLIVDRVLRRPTFTPVGMSVRFVFGEPEITKSGNSTVTAIEYWLFWMAEGQSAAFLVMMEDAPFDPDDDTFDAWMLDELDQAWKPPANLTYWCEDFFPGHQPEWYRSSLARSFERLHQKGHAVLCMTDTSDYPWWEPLHDCPHQPDPGQLLTSESFWTVDRDQPGEQGFYWFTLTPDGVEECERVGCKETSDEIDDFLQQETPNWESAYMDFFD